MIGLRYCSAAPGRVYTRIALKSNENRSSWRLLPADHSGTPHRVFRGFGTLQQLMFLLRRVYARFNAIIHTPVSRAAWSRSTPCRRCGDRMV